MHNSLGPDHRTEDDVGELVERIGCFGVSLLVLIGLGMLIYGAHYMHQAVWGKVVGGIGFLLIIAGVGVRGRWIRRS